MLSALHVIAFLFTTLHAAWVLCEGQKQHGLWKSLEHLGSATMILVSLSILPQNYITYMCTRVPHVLQSWITGQHFALQDYARLEACERLHVGRRCKVARLQWQTDSLKALATGVIMKEKKTGTRRDCYVKKMINMVPLNRIAIIKNNVGNTRGKVRMSRVALWIKFFLKSA